MTQPWPLASWKYITNPDSSLHPKSAQPSEANPKSAHAWAITILDIPHIVGFICDNLSTRDIWNCYRVNTTWREIFGLHRFRKVKFANLSATQTWDILENAHHIRTLIMDWTDGDYFLHEPISSWLPYTIRPVARCTNLRVLHYCNFRYVCTRQDDPNHDCQTHTHSKCLKSLDLISQNLKLETVSMDLYGIYSNLFSGHALKSLSELRFPRSIRATEIYNSQLHDLLSHLPVSLEELIIWNLGTFAHDEFSQPISAPATNLRRLTLLLANASTYLGPLLKQSPLLEEVVFQNCNEKLPGLIAILFGHCPKIHSIQFHFEAPAFVNPLLPLVFEVYKELRTLVWYSTFDFVEYTLPFATLLKQSAYTMDTICLGFAVDVDGINIQVGTMLRTFPNLRVAQFGTSYEVDYRHGTHIHDLLYDEDNGSVLTSPKESRHIPWACRNLEEFGCHIVHTSGLVMNIPLWEKQAWIARQVGQLYQELRSLKRLTQLDLKWSDWEDGHGRQIPHETGLELMIRHGQPEKYRMSTEDLLWMNLHWPTLAEFEERKTIEVLCSVSKNHRTGCYYPSWWVGPNFSMQMDELHWARVSSVGDYMDEWNIWDNSPMRINKKKLSKTNRLYAG